MLTKTEIRKEVSEERETFVDTRVPSHVRIIGGALDMAPDSPSGIVLNGRIDLNTLRFLKVDSYQRPLRSRADIFQAYKEGIIVPNIVLGVRGQDFMTEGDDYVIRSPVFIIDGWQRVGNALRLLELIPDKQIRLFATAHFNTTDVWERHHFTALNKNTSRVSPSLHLRNTRDANEGTLALYSLSERTKEFPLYKKVCWSQSMQRGQLISGMTVCRVACNLHRHKGGIAATQADNAQSSLLDIVTQIGAPSFRQNMTAYFSLVNECWPFNAIEYRSVATQIKGSFLIELAYLLSNHQNFWSKDGRTLSINSDDKKRLAKFAISDPQVVQLAGKGGTKTRLLYRLILDHMNERRRTNQLIPWPASARTKPKTKVRA